ncbi:MAG: hypothetical protein AAFU41_00795 [Pseudomonadota bacterium]
MDDKTQIGRVAMRVSEDGEWWHGYYAMPGTMEGALLLGSIRMQFVQDEARKQAFMSLMQEAIGDILEAEIGERPSHYNVAPGPAHENRAARRRREAAERKRDRGFN